MKKIILLFITLSVSACAAGEGAYAPVIDSMQTELANLKGIAEQNSYEIHLLRDENERLRTELKELKSERSKSVNSGESSYSSSSQQITSPQIIVIEDPQSIRDSLYKYALELYNQKKYDQSIVKFNEFIAKLPNDRLAANSQYWIGENYYSKQDFERAIKEFQQVIDKYPNSNKVADAMLKIAYSYRLSGNNAMAKTYFDSVIRNYPESNAARLARSAIN